MAFTKSNHSLTMSFGRWLLVLLTACSMPTCGALEVADHRMVAFLGNWQPCPSAAQYAEYTHVMISFAISYVWGPSRNSCSSTCDIYEPVVCNGQPNQAIIQEMQAAGTKVLLSFGGAGMGGSWVGAVNDCWEYCYGREDQVVSRLTELVTNMNLDGIDIDYEYFVEDNPSRGFTRGAEAVHFLREITVGLRQQLGPDKIVTHTPMDVDLVPGRAYYELLVDIGYDNLDMLMPQYYNGITRPNTRGWTGKYGDLSAQAHYNDLLIDVFRGDATKMLFGFCISDCGATSSNADSSQAVSLLEDLGDEHSCHGGAFFWVAARDNGWASVVNDAMDSNRGCSSQPVAPVAPVPTPVTAPVPTPMSAPVERPSGGTSPVLPDGRCCPENFSGLLPLNQCQEFFACTDGVVVGSIIPCQTGLLFDANLQVCDYARKVTCSAQEVCENDLPPSENEEPSGMPSLPPTTVPSALPSGHPSATPSTFPSAVPSGELGGLPSTTPSAVPVGVKSAMPSMSPSVMPSRTPNAMPSAMPSFNPSDGRTMAPSRMPSVYPSSNPPVLTPVAAPIAPSTPGSDQCCTTSEGTQYRAYDDCRQYYVCNKGEVVSTQPCAIGLYFSEDLRTCVWQYQLTGGCKVDTCGAAPSPAAPPVTPPVTPVAAPVTAPVKEPSTEAPSTMPSGVPSVAPSPIPSAVPSTAPSTSPSAGPSAEPSWVPSSAPSANPSAAPVGTPSAEPSPAPTDNPSPAPSNRPSPAPEAGCCPAGYTGIRTFGECEQYHWCVNGEVSGKLYTCAKGTLFDVSVKVCNWKSAGPVCRPLAC